MVIDFIIRYNSAYINAIQDFLAWYADFGRSILDLLYFTFNGTFNILFGISVIVSIVYFFVSIYMLFHKDKEKQVNYDGEIPFVTVQIPTYNELVAIRCARHCLEFDYPQEKYEILIGDDSNLPEISRKLQQFAKENPRVKILKRPTNAGFKPGNLNNMLKYSRGEIIAIFDSDFIPPENFLKRIVIPFMKDKKVAGAQARWKVINPNQNMITVLGATIVATCHQVTLPFMYHRRGISFLCGSAEAVRKDVLLKLGSWEHGNLTEDIEFSLRLLESGYKIEYIHDLECDSEVPYTLKDLYRQQMRWAYGVIYSWKKHFKTLRMSNHLDFIDKFYMGGIFCSGYFLSLLLAGLFITGTLAFFTHAPEPINWAKFFMNLGRNVFLTSGLIVTSIVALKKANKSRLTFRMIASSFSYGIVVTYYVNVGIIKAFAKTPMEWYMLKKQGNDIN